MEVICGRCGYELLGLGQQGRCPECGTYFNLHTGEGLRHAGNPEHYSLWLAARLRTIMLAVVSVLMIICSGASALATTRGPWIGGMIALTLILGTVVSYLYEPTKTPALDDDADEDLSKLTGPTTASPTPASAQKQRAAKPTPIICGKCGYNLWASPARGQCPECGQVYDKGTSRGIRLTLTAEERRYLATRRVVNAIVGVVCLFLILLAGSLYLYLQGPKRTIAAALALMFAGALFVASRIDWREKA